MSVEWLWVQAAGEGLRIREIPVRLIYNHDNRYFGGTLDDPDTRLLYYYEVLLHELGNQGRSLERFGIGDVSPRAFAEKAF